MEMWQIMSVSQFVSVIVSKNIYGLENIDF